jgi:multidrug efflux system membrane fusion protein
MSQSPTEPHRPKAAPRPDPQPPAGQPKRRDRRALYWTVLVLIVIAAAAFWIHRSRAAQHAVSGGGGGRGGRGAFGASGPLPVVVNTARKADVNIILRGLGTVSPLATITVRTQISGYLAEVKFTEGQMVNKGDILAVIDPRPYEVALEQAQGQLLQAQAQFKEAQIDLDRYVTLSAQDSISKQQVDAQRALVAQFEGMTKTNQGAVDSAMLNLTYCHIVAPVSGRVGLRQIDQGNYVTPGDANGLVLLTQIQPITVIFTLPEDNIPGILKRLDAKTAIQVDAYNRDNTVKLATGTLETVDNTVDTTTGTVKLRAVFKNEDGALFPNQFVNAAMLLDVLHGATVISTSAIERGQDGSFVYVVGADSKVSAKTVTLGATEGERVAVLTGVSVGDKVVVDGADRLKDGMEVAAQFPARPGGAGAGKPGGPGAGQGRQKPGGAN